MTTTPVDIHSLAAGRRVQDTFVVTEVENRVQADGSPFAILTLGNSTGRIPSAPVWSSELHRVQGVARGTVVSVTADVSEYRGDLQLRLVSVQAVPPDLVDWTRLLPSVGDVTPFWAKLDGWRAEMAAGPWKRAVDAFYDDPDFRRAYESCPGSISNHHSALGGLLRHTVEVGVIARAVARTCSADADLVLAGVLLHDIGKTEAYRWDGVFRMTEPGSLVGHVVQGSLMLDRRLAELEPPLSEREEWLLQHLILSHHGALEHGSPVLPMTLEAEVLHAADEASAGTANVADAIRDDSNFAEGESVSKRIWSLERRVYRAPRD